MSSIASQLSQTGDCSNTTELSLRFLEKVLTTLWKLALSALGLAKPSASSTLSAAPLAAVQSSWLSTTQDSATAGNAITSKTIDVRWILRDFFAGLFMGLFMLTDDMKGAIVSNKVENFQRNEREGPHGSKNSKRSFN